MAKASVANLPFIGAITVALQFLFVQRRGSADKTNKHTQAAGQTVEKMAERAADRRSAAENLPRPAHLPWIISMFTRMLAALNFHHICLWLLGLSGL